MTKIKLFSVTYVNSGFILNVTTLIIQIRDIFRTVMNPGTAQNVAAQFFLLTPYQATRNFLACCTNIDNNITLWKDLKNDHNGSLSLKHSNLQLLVNQFNNATPANNNDPEKIASSKYYDIDEMYNIEIPQKNKSLSLIHINACSLNKFLFDFQHLLSCIKKTLT